MKLRHEKYLKQFGENLKRLIQERELSVEAFAIAADIEPRIIYRVIAADTSVTLSTLVTIAKGLDMEVKELFEF